MWSLKRTKQCSKCSWRKDVNPHDIPNGYSLEKHRNLIGTIAKGSTAEQLQACTLKIMACHEYHETHCIGWLMNQLGNGNNISLRLQVRKCTNLSKVETVGEQHECFEDTLPKEE